MKINESLSSDMLQSADFEEPFENEQDLKNYLQQQSLEQSLSKQIIKPSKTIYKETNKFKKRNTQQIEISDLKKTIGNKKEIQQIRNRNFTEVKDNYQRKPSYQSQISKNNYFRKKSTFKQNNITPQKSIFEKQKILESNPTLNLEQKQLKDLKILDINQFKGFNNLSYQNFDQVQTLNDKTSILTKKKRPQAQTLPYQINLRKQTNKTEEAQIDFNEESYIEDKSMYSQEIDEDEFKVAAKLNHKHGIELKMIIQSELDLSEKIKAYKRKKTILRNLIQTKKFIVNYNRKFNQFKSLEKKEIEKLRVNLTKQQQKLAQKFQQRLQILFKAKSQEFEELLIVKFSHCKKKIAFSLIEGYLIILRLCTDEYQKLLDPNNFLVLKTQESKKQIILIEWSYDDNYIATAHLDYKLIVWDMKTLKVIKVISQSSMITAISFFGKKNVIASGLKIGEIRFWDIFNEQSIFWFQTSPNITAIKFSPSSELLVVGHLDGSFVVYKYNHKFINIFTGNIKKLNYDSKRAQLERENKQKPKTKKKGLFFLNKKKLKNFKILDIVFQNENQFYILSHNCRIKIFNLEKQLVEQKYCINRTNLIPQSMSFYKDYVLMATNNGKIYFWNKSNSYVPPFNYNYFSHNPLINFSYEEFQAMEKITKTSKNFYACFLSKDIVEDWNRRNPDMKVELILFYINSQGIVSFSMKKLNQFSTCLQMNKTEIHIQSNQNVQQIFDVFKKIVEMNQIHDTGAKIELDHEDLNSNFSKQEFYNFISIIIKPEELNTFQKIMLKFEGMNMQDILQLLKFNFGSEQNKVNLDIVHLVKKIFDVNLKEK